MPAGAGGGVLRKLGEVIRISSNQDGGISEIIVAVGEKGSVFLCKGSALTFWFCKPVLLRSNFRWEHL